MFKDTFEHPASAQACPLSPTEQMFWRIVRMNPELAQAAETLKQRGQFKAIPGASANYMRYQFTWNGQHRQFEAEITPNSNAIQINNFLNTCAKGVNGVFDQPNIHSYLRVNRRPL
jgi:hypothetical protein